MVQAFTYEDTLVKNINIQLQSSAAVSDFPHEEEYEVKFVFPGIPPIVTTAVTDKDATKVSFIILSPSPSILDLLSSESTVTLEIPFLADFSIRLNGSASAITQYSACAAKLGPPASEPAVNLPPIPTVSEPWGVVAVPPFDGCAVGTLESGRGVVIRTNPDQPGAIQFDAVYDFAPEVLAGMTGGTTAQILVRGPDKDYKVRMVSLSNQDPVLTAYNVPDELLTQLTIASTLLVRVPGLRDLRVDLKNTKSSMETWRDCLARRDDN